MPLTVPGGRHQHYMAFALMWALLVNIDHVFFGGVAGPGWTTIWRGPWPTVMVAVTLRLMRSTTETSFEPSFVT
jgi:hypothetical protein